MLAALLTAWFLMSSGGALGYIYDLGDIKDLVKEEVTDPVRKAEALDTIDALKDDAKQYNKARNSAAQSLDELLLARPDDDDDFDALLDGLAADVAVFHDSFLDRRFELRQQLTRGEWEAVFAERANLANPE